MRVAFVHANMALGGAEQWVINMATGLQRLGCYVKIFTPFWDKNRCLDQLKNGSIDLEVHGDIIPKKIFGQFNALCVWIRVTLAAIYLLLFGGNYDLVIVDQISLPLPLLRLRFNTYFYCHFPDKLFGVHRETIWRKLYRGLLDILEEITMFFANDVAVNSHFTQQKYMESFHFLTKFNPSPPKVIYPCIEPSHYEKSNFTKKDLYNIRGLESLKSKNISKLKIMSSLNRYEFKKNIKLALEAFLEFMTSYSKNHSKEETINHILIIAGGYDTEVTECKGCIGELEKISNESEYKENIFILKNISSEERTILLNSSNVLMYTPKDEHFGIVPIEGMVNGAIAFCHKSGGPLESVAEGVTGYLLDNQDGKEWGKKLFKFFNRNENFQEDGLNNSEIIKTLKNYVKEKFSVDCMMKETLSLWKINVLDSNKLKELMKNLPQEYTEFTQGHKNILN